MPPASAPRPHGPGHRSAGGARFTHPSIEAALKLQTTELTPGVASLLAHHLGRATADRPFVVPAPIALDAISGTQVAIGIAVTFLGALVTIRLAGRIYAASLLAGGKLTWRGALKAEPVP